MRAHYARQRKVGQIMTTRCPSPVEIGKWAQKGERAKRKKASNATLDGPLWKGNPLQNLMVDIIITMSENVLQFIGYLLVRESVLTNGDTNTFKRLPTD